MYKILVLVVLIASSAVLALAQENDSLLVYEGEAFSLEYPDHWELSETEELVQLGLEDYVLTIHTTDVHFGLPAGDFERHKRIGRYGIPVDVLIYENRIKQVLYGRLETPETMLTIMLGVESDHEVDYDEIDIPQNVVDQASMMISSIVLHNAQPDEVVIIPFFDNTYNPIDDWETYTHPSQPFGFRYPPTWSLQESTNRLILSQAEIQFVIAYADIKEERPTVDTELMLSSNLQIRVPVYGMFQAIPSEVVSPVEDGVIAVIYRPVSTLDNHFVMWVTHVDNGLLDWAMLDEIDTIISTFKTRPPLAPISSD